MALAAGTRLGPYALTATIGAGGMGEVYKATDTRLDRTVAIKILPQHVAADPEVRQRFEREAKTLAALSHPNICPIFDIGQHEGIDFLVMEYLEGETLADRLAKGALPVDLVLRIATELADALDKAHRQGIVHRDVKPGNVMLTRSGAKLLDFGLAKLQPTHAISGMSIAATVSQPITGHGTLLGTLHYMSPEQVEGKDADSRSDIFGLGAVIYEMVTGKKAFEGKSAASVIASVMEREPLPIATLQPLTPPALDHLVGQCLSKDPDERWQSAGDIKLAFKWISSAGSHSEAPVRGSPALLTRERLWWLSVLAVVIILAAGALMWALRSAPRAPETRLEITTPPVVDLAAFALSPDGRMIVYAAGVGEQPRLWLRMFADGTSRPLDGTEGAQHPFWSPDSLFVGFFTNGRLKILDIAGRSVRTLASVAQGHGGTWNRNNVIVYGSSGVTGLFRVSSEGGTPRPATTLRPSQRAHTFPQFLPDGRHFLFFVQGPPDTRGVYVGELDSSEIRRLVDADAGGVFAPPDRLMFARQNTLFSRQFSPARLELTGVPEAIAEQVATDFSGWRAAVSTDDAGMIAFRPSGGASERRYIWFDRAGKELGPVSDSDLGNTPNLGSTPTLSPDERRLAFPRPLDGNTDVWILEIARGFLTKFTSHPALESHPLWSPDGKRIVFQRFAENRGDLFIKPADGEGTEQLVLSNSRGNIPTDWSRDGHFILFKVGLPIQDGGGTWDILALRIDGDRTPFPVVQTTADERDGQFSPDGKWVVYQSDESGEIAIWVQPFQRQGKRERISPAGGVQARWSANGKEIFYLTLDGELMSVPIQFDPTGQTIRPGTPVRLFKTRVVGIVLPIARQQYTPSADGKRFLVHTITGEATTPPITVILNKRASAVTSAN